MDRTNAHILCYYCYIRCLHAVNDINQKCLLIFLLLAEVLDSFFKHIEAETEIA